MSVVSRFIFVLGTDHRLQGSPSIRSGVDDPGYAIRLKQIISGGIDYIFEEASECGSTQAKALIDSLNLNNPSRVIEYLDIDPAHPNRQKFGIVTSTGQPFPDDESLEREEEKVGLQAQREELWMRRIVAKDFESGLVICGCAHTLSLAFKLQSAGFGVKFDTYIPHDKLCGHRPGVSS